MNQLIDNIRIVLVETSHPGNIGATARAMKTMGLRSLVLVNPKHFPNANATEMASSADDLLTQATVVDTLSQAIADCGLVIGTSARPREIPLPGLLPRAAAEKTVAVASKQPVALVFGREKSGLNNQELQHCHYHLTIPTNPEYCSLNLAAAVQVVAYECRLALLNEQPIEEKIYDSYATAAEEAHFYQHLLQLLETVNFIQPGQPKKLMPKLKRLFNRAKLEKMEINMLRGIFTAIEDKVS